MARPGQISLWHLFVELTLIAAAIGAIRLIVIYWDDHESLHRLVVLSMLCAVPLLFGTAIGGIRGSFRTGALWGLGVLVALFFLLALFGPQVQ